MQQILRERLRWALDQQSDDLAMDAITRAPARAARGNDFQIELGFFVTIDDVLYILDVSQYESITFTLKADSDRGGVTLIQKTAGTFNLALTQDAWDSGAAQHVLIQIPAAETNLDLGNADEKTFFWSVRARTTSGTDVTLGTGQLVLYNDGVGGNPTPTPALGSSLIPAGTNYTGAGAYVLNGLTVGSFYSWDKGANDTDLVNGTVTLTSTGWFQAQATSVTLHGTASSLITALVRWPRVAMLDDLTAATAGMLKIINAPGVAIGVQSENGRYLGLIGMGNDGMFFQKPIDLLNQ